MILIGDKNIPYENIKIVYDIDDIKNTKANSIVLFDFNIALLKYTQLNDVKSAVLVHNIKDVIYASNLDAFYIIPNNDILIKTQKLADNYMFDSKILAIIENDEELEQMALEEIDGVIYKELIQDE